MVVGGGGPGGGEFSPLALLLLCNAAYKDHGIQYLSKGKLRQFQLHFGQNLTLQPWYLIMAVNYLHVRSTINMALPFISY